MADSILNQAFFGLYEFFANIIPGTIIFSTLILFLQIDISGIGFFPESLQILLFILVAFIIGLTMQALSSLITKGTKYPSKFYLDKDDKVNSVNSSWYFPKFMKDDIRKNANEVFGVPIDADSQDVFDACYIYLLQNKVQTRIQTFQHLYTLARCMIATMLVEFGLFMAWSFIIPQPFLIRFEPIF